MRHEPAAYARAARTMLCRARPGLPRVVAVERGVQVPALSIFRVFLGIGGAHGWQPSHDVDEELCPRRECFSPGTSHKQHETRGLPKTLNHDDATLPGAVFLLRWPHAAPGSHMAKAPSRLFRPTDLSLLRVVIVVPGLRGWVRSERFRGGSPDNDSLAFATRQGERGGQRRRVLVSLWQI